MEEKVQSLQNEFLNGLRKSKAQVSIFLVNGIKLQGRIEAFDNYVIMLKAEISQVVFKHSISTVVPDSRPSYPQNSRISRGLRE